MAKSIIGIDESLFLKDLKTFEKYLLPAINKDRLASGFRELTDQEAIDYYLDLLNEHNAKPDGGPDQRTS